MVPALELTEEEVLECLKKILKGVCVVPLMVLKYHVDNPPPTVSCFTSASTFIYIFFIACTFCLHFPYFSSCCWLSIGFGSEFCRYDPR
jgi:hypothetical protein